jgi:hypothetical protein
VREHRKRVAGASFTAAEWLALNDHYGHRCLRCGQPEPVIVLQPDHLLPVALGGRGHPEHPTTLGPCNHQKNARFIGHRPLVHQAAWICCSSAAATREHASAV